MYGTAYSAWLRASMDAWMLGLESSSVIALRMAKLAGGGEAASREAQLMVSEKIHAGIELQSMLPGTTPLGATQQALRHYRRKVGANRSRLTG